MNPRRSANCRNSNDYHGADRSAMRGISILSAACAGGVAGRAQCPLLQLAYGLVRKPSPGYSLGLDGACPVSGKSRRTYPYFRNLCSNDRYKKAPMSVASFVKRIGAAAPTTN